jgi:hypothetical protein
VVKGKCFGCFRMLPKASRMLPNALKCSQGCSQHAEILIIAMSQSPV